MAGGVAWAWPQWGGVAWRVGVEPGTVELVVACPYLEGVCSSWGEVPGDAPCPAGGVPLEGAVPSEEEVVLEEADL